MKREDRCKCCYHYKTCLDGLPQEHPDGIWYTLEEKNWFMNSLMMDCFKSPLQYTRDIESEKKSREKEKEVKEYLDIFKELIK